jgi:hypothetical protein
MRPIPEQIAGSAEHSAGDEVLRARVRSLAEAFKEQANIPGERRVQVDLGSCRSITANQDVQSAALELLQCAREVRPSEREACAEVLRGVLSGYCDTVDVLLERYKNAFNPFTKTTIARGARDVEGLGLVMKCAFGDLTGGHYAPLEARLSELQRIVKAHEGEAGADKQTLQK